MLCLQGVGGFGPQTKPLQPRFGSRDAEDREPNYLIAVSHLPMDDILTLDGINDTLKEWEMNCGPDIWSHGLQEVIKGLDNPPKFKPTLFPKEDIDALRTGLSAQGLAKLRTMLEGSRKSFIKKYGPLESHYRLK